MLVVIFYGWCATHTQTYVEKMNDRGVSSDGDVYSPWMSFIWVDGDDFLSVFSITFYWGWRSVKNVSLKVVKLYFLFNIKADGSTSSRHVNTTPRKHSYGLIKTDIPTTKNCQALFLLPIGLNSDSLSHASPPNAFYFS